jgi:hypothetical protein
MEGKNLVGRGGILVGKDFEFFGESLGDGDNGIGF